MCKKQWIVSLLIAKVEYKGVVIVGIEATWIRNLRREIEFSHKESTTMYFDYQSAI